jgi:hypothetical protein
VVAKVRLVRRNGDVICHAFGISLIGRRLLHQPVGSRVCATLTEATGDRYPDAAEGYPKAAEIMVGAQPF